MVPIKAGTVTYVSGLEAVGEKPTPLRHTEYSTAITKIKAADPDAVFNTLNGNSNVAFFKQLKNAGIPAEDLTRMSGARL